MTEGRPAVASHTSSSSPNSTPVAPPWKALVAPAVAITAMTLVSILNTQLTAAFLFHISADIAVGYSLWSCIISPLCIVPVFFFVPSWFTWLRCEYLGDFALLCVFRFMDLSGSNIALSSISTALEQTIVASKPVITILLESLILLRPDHWVVYVVVAAVAVGDALAATTGDYISTTAGIIAAVVAAIGSAGRYVYTRRLVVRGKHPIHPVALIFWFDLVLIFPFLIWALASSQLQAFVFGVNDGPPDIDEGTQTVILPAGTHYHYLGQATGVALLNGFKTVSQCAVLVYVSATSLSVAYVIAPTINILLSLLVTQTHAAGPLGPASVVGISMIGAFNLVYMYLRVDSRALPAVDRALGCAERREAEDSSMDSSKGPSQAPAPREDTPLKGGDP